MKQNETSSNLVFVYGSLKEGFHNHHLLSDRNSSLYLFDGETQDKFTLLDLGTYPGVTLKPTSKIQGEIYNVSPECFSQLDNLEGYPDYYSRKKVKVISSKDSSIAFEAWMYYLDGQQEEYFQTPITSGNWEKDCA